MACIVENAPAEGRLGKSLCRNAETGVRSVFSARVDD